jgi:hypothetical protein
MISSPRCSVHLDIEVQSLACERMIEIQDHSFLFHLTDMDDMVFSFWAPGVQSSPDLLRCSRNFGLWDFLALGSNGP